MTKTTEEKKEILLNVLRGEYASDHIKATADYIAKTYVYGKGKLPWLISDFIANEIAIHNNIGTFQLNCNTDIYGLPSLFAYHEVMVYDSVCGHLRIKNQMFKDELMGLVSKYPHADVPNTKKAEFEKRWRVRHAFRWLIDIKINLKAGSVIIKLPSAIGSILADGITIFLNELNHELFCDIYKTIKGGLPEEYDIYMRQLNPHKNDIAQNRLTISKLCTELESLRGSHPYISCDTFPAQHESFSGRHHLSGESVNLFSRNDNGFNNSIEINHRLKKVCEPFRRSGRLLQLDYYFNIIRIYEMRTGVKPLSWGQIEIKINRDKPDGKGYLSLQAIRKRYDSAESLINTGLPGLEFPTTPMEF